MPITAGHFSDLRRTNKNALLNFVRDNLTQDRNMSMTKIVALFSNISGISVKTLNEYLEELKQAELIE